MITSAVNCRPLKDRPGSTKAAFRCFAMPWVVPARRSAASSQRNPLADGLCDAAIAIRRERNRPPGLRWPNWEQAHLRKLDQAYDLLEREVLPPNNPVDIEQIALATALAWIEFPMQL